MTIKNDPAQYKKREKLAAAKPSQKTEAVYSPEEVLAILRAADPNGYVTWNTDKHENRVTPD